MEAVSAPRTAHAIRVPKPRRLLAAMSDERLVEHIRRGDPVAFEVLYDRHSAGILGFCRHTLGSATDAEDALQHTFIAAHADIQRHGRRDLHVKAWLYTIARNRCLSMLRARREHPTDQAIELVTDRFDDDAEQREDLRALLDDLHKLPREQREALVLAEVGDLSHEDISKILGCEASKVKSLVFQARTALIDRRTARETPCEEIREQIATLRGGALRRSSLRHHIEACPGCAEYREQVRRQRAMLAVALPIVPSAALRSHILGSIGMGGGTTIAAGGAGASGVSFLSGGGVAAKLGLVAVLAAGGGGAAVAENGGVPLLHHPHPTAEVKAQASGVNGHGAKGAAAKAGTTPASQHASTVAVRKHSKHSRSHRSASGAKHGFTPTTGGSNGAAAKQFASTRGKGNHTGIVKHPTTGSTQRSAKSHAKHVAAPKQRVTHTPPPTAKKPPVKPQPAPRSTAPATTVPAPAPTGGGDSKAGGNTGISGKSIGSVTTDAAPSTGS